MNENIGGFRSFRSIGGFGRCIIVYRWERIFSGDSGYIVNKEVVFFDVFFLFC